MTNPLDEKYAFRADMIARLHDDLIGPSGGVDEVLDESPLDRYVVGVLWPSASGQQEEVGEEPIEGDARGDEGEEDTPVSQSLTRYPSAAGITFAVDLARTQIARVRISAAHYRPEHQSYDSVGPAQLSRSRRSAGERWRRFLPSLEPVEIDLTRIGPRTETLVDGLELYVLVRPPDGSEVTVTVVLVNAHPVPARGGRDGQCWFQVSVDVETDTPAIVSRERAEASGHDPDLDSSSLLYRDFHTFAAGHGCSASWSTSSNSDTAVSAVSTTFLPSHALRRAQPAQVGAADLRMSFLASASQPEIEQSLRTVVRVYRAWIRQQVAAAALPTSNITGALREVADRHVRDAAQAADRIEAGIELLVGQQRDPEAIAAFRLMNRAMQLQRAQQDWIRGGAAAARGSGESQAWYPFQLAFVLINLPALTDPQHPDRDIADLLWFPTGGGKTEAYLGLVAYAIVLRRLRDRHSTGVAVIMRYTLRLLTIQQFERATMLMCSLEQVRSETAALSGPTFSIGLWVGKAATPNTLDAARKALNKLRAGRDVEEGNPMQLLQCPWCGHELTADNYRVTDRPDRRLVIACGRARCDFKDGLPVHLVDEDVYRERPALLIGTVDKFAQMAWSPNVRLLFARDGTGHRPDLIIQDELHLISGPLGSMVGLYETAVDAACSTGFGDPSETSSRPKIVASTATIRRATEQVRAVFARESCQFPPPGLDPAHNFFAHPAPPDELGDRMYVGVMAPGTSHQTLMIRVYASLLQSAADISGSAETRDPYWTLLGYFNSLRVLGSANLQVQDDVDTRLTVLAGRSGTTARSLGQVSELTSRVNARDIPSSLKHLEVGLPREDADDVVLATNMISVGLDVDRLGLMTVMGQPQSSAEYIQATSRVGRKHPGLVVTILNATRSRDRSHYESFVGFHQSIYRAVEATSATPFAARARDRGLPGVLTALARTLFDDLSPEVGAGRVDGQADKLERAAAVIAARASVCSDEGAETMAQVDELVEEWLDAAATKPNLVYRDRTNWEAALLVDPTLALVDPDVPNFGERTVPWPTLQSLRDVDAESTLYQIPRRRRS